MNQKLEYTGWLYLIGVLGLLLGAEMAILAVFLYPYVDMQLTILGAFLIPSAILFLLIKREITYIIYTGMFVILSVVRTVYPIIYREMYLGAFLPFISSVAFSVGYWVCLGYLIYKYFNFKGTIADGKTYEDLKAEFFKYFDRYSKDNKENTNSKSQATYEERTYEQRDEEPSKSWYYTPNPYYYRVLGVGRRATPEEIKGAYRGLVKMYHPDLSDDPDTEQKFREIQKAYNVLSDPDKRTQYDRFEDGYSE